MVRYILDNGNRKASSGDEDLVFTVMKNMLVQFCQAVAELHPSIHPSVCSSFSICQVGGISSQRYDCENTATTVANNEMILQTEG